MFFDIFFAAPAGRTMREFIRSIPTHCIDIVTTMAIVIVNSNSIKSILVPLALARHGLKLERNRWLNKKYHTSNMKTKTRNKARRSPVEILKRSPMR